MAKKSQYNQKINYFKKETDTKIRLIIAKGEGSRGGREMCWEFQIGRYKLLHLGPYIKVLLYSIGNYIQYPVINCNGKEYFKKECILKK